MRLASLHPARCAALARGASGRRPALGVWALLVAWVLLGAMGPAHGAETGAPPFGPGEKLTFEIRWGPVLAGTAELATLPFQTLDGIRAYHFTLTARTNAYLDRIYKVRNRIDAFADTGLNQSLRYLRKQHEGFSKRNILVDFDWERMEAQYSDAGNKRDPIRIQPGTFDVLSAFHAMRLTDWERAAEVQRPVTDGKKAFMGKARLIRRETIQVPAGTFDTLLVEPDVAHLGGVFEKSPGARIEIWLTADRRQIPVRLRSEVIVGSFVAELVALQSAGSLAGQDRSGNGMAGEPGAAGLPALRAGLAPDAAFESPSPAALRREDPTHLPPTRKAARRGPPAAPI